MTTEAPKLVQRRDSATTILRKLGVNSRDYGLFIKQSKSGFIVDVALARKHANNVSAQTEKSSAPWDDKKAPKAVKKTAQKPAALAAEKTDRRSRTGAAEQIRQMIRDGMSNKDIAAKLELPDNKKHYPSWYRAEMARKEAAK